MHLSIPPEATVASVLDAHPGAARVFARHHIDFCCRGQRPIAEAAQGADVSLDTLAREIASSEASPAQVGPHTPTRDLIDHIVARHHRPLDEELPRLGALAAKVARVHGGPANLAVQERLSALAGELVAHMEKEEAILFPLFAAADPRARMPLAVMHADHELVGDLLRELRSLTADYAVPPQACGSWRALWAGLEALERDLHEHIHLENNVLFPRAFAAIV